MSEEKEESREEFLTKENLSTGAALFGQALAGWPQTVRLLALIAFLVGALCTGTILVLGYLPPFGWVNTGIELRAGQAVEVQSSGAAHISSGQLDARIARRRQLQREHPDLSDAEIEAELRKEFPHPWPWLKPGGQPWYGGPEAPVQDPLPPLASVADGVSVVSSGRYEYTANGNGVLHFAVNDVGRPQFMEDNRGLYWVRVEVEPESKSE